MTVETTSIPDLLIKHRGNQTQLARELGINRLTVGKFARDFKCQYHVICNGVLMTKSKLKGNQRGIR
ncbi:NinH [Xenorhabdus sp. M]|uniref:NinH n=1 Tax=Xenorhabdus szentirmaii TaxID=290112 RepID=A0AAW3YYA0_9GAMM|nr:helix-turn-helix domain-containing protein [Xenorhabdus sp. M]MBD2803040.1 NinH [Xenorhabdus sp. M]